MPELPEVETTIRGLRKTAVGLTIKDVWTDLKTKDKRQRDAVANPKYFLLFKKEVLNKKIVSVERRAKNILINLSGGKTILIHLKMTGHLLFNNKDKFVHLLFTLSGRNYLAFSDIRKFGKITLLDPEGKQASYGAGTKTNYFAHLGPEPLDKDFTWQKLKERLSKKPQGKIKIVLMDQSLLSGIGNIYSDEILWQSLVNPERKVKDIKDEGFKKIFESLQSILKKSISLGGDSMSDYINLFGKKGKFQLCHNAYRRTGEKCGKKGCKGIILRKIINGRSAHFCSIHQK